MLKRNVMNRFPHLPMRLLRQAELGDVEHLIDVEMPYAQFAARYIPKGAYYAEIMDLTCPVERWYFELPWGHRIKLEYHLTIGQFSIHLAILEIDAVMEFLDVQSCPHFVRAGVIALLKQSRPAYSDGLGKFGLYRQDDNGNQALMRTFESYRVADYYKGRYESLGHKQLYWVENETW